MLLSRFRRFFQGFQNKVALFLLIVTVIPISFLQLTNYRSELEVLSEKNNALLDDNLILSQRTGETVLSAYRNVLSLVSTDEALHSYLEEMEDAEQGSMLYAKLEEKIQQRILANILMVGDVRAVGLITTIPSPIFFSQNLERHAAMRDYFYAQCYPQGEALLKTLQPELTVVPGEGAQKGFLSLSFRILHTVTMKTLGGVVLFIQPDTLDQALNGSDHATYQFSDKLLVSSEDTVICSKNLSTGVPLARAQRLAKDFKNWDGGDFYESDTTIIKRIPMDSFGLSLVNVVNKDYLLEETRRIWERMFLFSGLIFLCVMVISYLYASSTVRSINRIARQMQQLDKDELTVPNWEKSRNQIAQIETALENMIQHLRSLLLQNKEQYEHLLEEKDRAQRSELRALELQINPHFLFNTIDSINWTAIRRGDFDISEQLSSLAFILRYTVYGTNDKVLLQNEMEWVTKYLALQQQRYGDLFDFEILPEPDIRAQQIHKLLLQPILENAILHGFSGFAGGRRIILTMREERLCSGEDALRLDVANNGHPIPTDKLAAIRRVMKHPEETPEGESIGVQNTAMRLKGYYRDNYRFEVSSNDEWTVFSIWIPLR